MASGVATVVNWVQRTVPWSNTPRAWLERLALFGLLLATAALVLFGRQLALWSYVLAWGGLLVVFGVLLRQGWVFVFGPVLFYDLIRSARRTRTYVVRFLYTFLLFVILCWVYAAWIKGRPAGPASSLEIAQFTNVFFVVFLATQLALVVLLTPAYVAGAISEEKERKTIEYILATDLRNREIVLGKFVARLLHLTVLVLAGLPILSAVQFMGGIDPNLLLAGYAGTGLTMLSIAGLSIFASTVTRRTRDAILIVYLTIFAYAGLWLTSEMLLLWAVGPRGLGTGWVVDVLGWVASAFRIGNPGYAIFSVTRGGTVIGSVVWAVLEKYAIFHGSLAAVSLVGSTLLLRRAALAEPRQPKATRRRKQRGKHRLVNIGNYPMIWKEVFAERGFRLHILLRILFVLLMVLSVVPLFFIFGSFIDQYFYPRNFYYGGMNAWDLLRRELNAYVRSVGMLVGMLGLIGVAVRAATSVRGEREKDTLDSLLTSPMSGEEILVGKWLGSVFSVRWVTLWLLFVWSFGALTGAMNFLMLPLLVLVWLAYAGASASLGLWFSVTAKSSLKAIISTLFIGLVITSAHWLPWFCCATVDFMPRGSGEDAVTTLMQIQMGLTPEVVLAMLPFRTDELLESHSRDFVPIKMVIFSVGGAFCWAIFAWGVWQATNERFKRLTFRAGRAAPDPRPRATVTSAWPEN